MVTTAPVHVLAGCASPAPGSDGADFLDRVQAHVLATGEPVVLDAEGYLPAPAARWQAVADLRAWGEPIDPDFLVESPGHAAAIVLREIAGRLSRALLA